MRQALQIIDGQTERLTNLIARVLEATRLNARQVPLDRQWTDLTGLARGVLAEIQMGTAGHTLRLRAQPGTMAMVDPARIEQVVVNLVANAVKYSPEGGAVECEIEAQPDGWVRLAVRDHGLGIPPEQRQHLFERFFQAHRSNHLGGVGLGLAISRQIVALHGGAIEAQFPDDGGTRFIVRLPVAPA